MVRATTNVLSTKERRPCNKATLLIRGELISTSETWKVQPITKAK